MRKHYDFSKAIKNPYAKHLKTQITLRIDNAIIDYFKEQSVKTSIPYQQLINFYLADCMNNKRTLKFKWLSDKTASNNT
jgi:uncharacterized protein (DUF4415 family)